MRRREFIAGLGGVAASGACAASRDSQNRCAVARSLAPRFATYGVISADASSWRSTSTKTLGLDVSPSFLARGDEVTE
jgi:hypothetical protein